MKVIVAGATGLVGSIMLKVLEERNFPCDELIAVASERSKGKTVMFRGNPITVITMEEALPLGADIALFSCGGSTSKAWAQKFADRETYVIDNSSAWRMEKDVPLVVPEVNASALNANAKIIANPNCSTIQMVVAINPLHLQYKIQRLVISTYQSVTGSGQKGKDQLESERSGEQDRSAYAHQIDLNVIPHGGDFQADGYTTEEIKLVNETRKIMGAEDLQITATVVRVPVFGGHSESVNVEFGSDFELNDVIRTLKISDGIEVIDNHAENAYPMPLDCEGKDEVFVGRIRRDHSRPRALNLWIVSDNLRKGAATNAVQIAEWLVKKGYVQTKVMSN